MQDLCNKMRIAAPYSASEQPERPQLPHQLRRQLIAGARAMTIRRRIVRIEVAPTLERSLRLRFGRHQRMIHCDDAAPVALLVGLDGESDNALAHADEAFDHPVERAAVKDLAGAFGHVARADAARPFAFAQTPLATQLDEVVEILDADRHLDEVKGHGASLPSGRAKTSSSAPSSTRSPTA